MNDMSRTIRPQFEQARLNEALFRAARAGETARVREALEAGAAPQVVLEATHARTLEWANLSDLKAHRFTGEPA